MTDDVKRILEAVVAEPVGTPDSACAFCGADISGAVNLHDKMYITGEPIKTECPVLIARRLLSKTA